MLPAGESEFRKVRLEESKANKGGGFTNAEFELSKRPEEEGVNQEKSSERGHQQLL